MLARREGRKKGNFDEEAKFIKRKATRVPSKPLAPYAGRSRSTGHERYSGQGLRLAHTGKEGRRGWDKEWLATAGCRRKTGSLPEDRYVWRRKGGAPPEGTAKQGAEAGKGQNVRAKPRTLEDLAQKSA